VINRPEAGIHHSQNCMLLSSLAIKMQSLPPARQHRWQTQCYALFLDLATAAAFTALLSGANSLFGASSIILQTPSKIAPFLITSDRVQMFP